MKNPGWFLIMYAIALLILISPILVLAAIESTGCK